jgi:hypothetical protein
MAKWIVVDLAFFAMDLSICVGKKEKKKVWNLPTRLYILWIYKSNNGVCLSICVDKNWAMPGRFFQSLPVPCGAGL